MKIAIMQPYFLPYIGYFQLMNAVDEFVIYDNIEFSKKGWVNRNRILVNGKAVYITLPLKKDSDFLNIKDRYLAASWDREKNKMLARITTSYRKSPHFDCAYETIKKCILFDECNLFRFVLNSLTLIKEYLSIPTPFVISSTIPIDHDLRSERKVIAICKARQMETYLNPIGGMRLYQKDQFAKEELDLHFLRTNEFQYEQFQNDFIPFLSILDVMMFNSKQEISDYLNTCFAII